MTAKTTTKFSVGDRVRRNDLPDGRPGMSGMVFEIAIDADDYHVTYGTWSNWVEGCDLTIVAPAYYPPSPDAPMLALTPDLLPHLESCIRQAEYAYGKTPHVEKMRAAIDAAQKEAAR